MTLFTLPSREWIKGYLIAIFRAASAVRVVHCLYASSLTCGPWRGFIKLLLSSPGVT
jgi:hypothetical protein